MKIIYCEQGGDQRLEARRGKITASRFKDVLAKGRGGAESKTRRSYMIQLAAEALSDEHIETYSNEYMEWGTLTEPQARAMYELDTGNTVEQVGLVLHDSAEISVSPDGIIGEDGGIEIKCPKTTTQIETYLSGKMPTVHTAQVQGSMWITGREWWDFVSFDPRINGAAGYFHQRIERDEKYISELEEKCLEFESELQKLIDQLKG